MDEHLYCFQFSATKNKAGMDFFVPAFWYTVVFISFEKSTGMELPGHKIVAYLVLEETLTFYKVIVPFYTHQ